MDSHNRNSMFRAAFTSLSNAFWPQLLLGQNFAAYVRLVARLRRATRSSWMARRLADSLGVSAGADPCTSAAQWTERGRPSVAAVSPCSLWALGPYAEDV